MTDEATPIAPPMEQERADFEATMAAKGYHLNPRRYTDGTYRDAEYQAGWEMWASRARAAEKDAARYRWLRDDNATDFGEPWVVTRRDRNDKEPYALNGEELDAAIDAAITAT